MRIGFEICEDAWVADRPGGKLARHGVDLILNPSASHFAFGKHEIRKRFVTEGSRAFNVGYVYANLLGNESGRAIYDGDAMIAQAGKLLVTGPRFSYADWHVTQAVVDIDAIRMSRARTGSYRPTITPASRRNGRPHRSTFPQLEPERDTSLASRLGNLAAHQGRRVHPGRVAGPVRLPPQEPLAGFRRLALRRGRFGGRLVSRRAAGRFRTGGNRPRRACCKKLSYIRGLEQAKPTTKQTRPPACWPASIKPRATAAT